MFLHKVTDISSFSHQNHLFKRIYEYNVVFMAEMHILGVKKRNGNSKLKISKIAYM